MYRVKAWYFGCDEPEYDEEGFRTKATAIRTAKEAYREPGADCYAAAVYERIDQSTKWRKIWDTDYDL